MRRSDGQIRFRNASTLHLQKQTSKQTTKKKTQTFEWVEKLNLDPV